jgi:integrase
MGKGSKERRVTVAPTLGRRLRRYAKRGRPRDVNSDRLLTTTRRTAPSPAASASTVVDRRRDPGEQLRVGEGVEAGTAGIGPLRVAAL